MDDEFQKVKNYALKLLSFRPRSEHEVKTRLEAYISKKHLSPDLVKQVLDRLKDLSYINDTDFAKWWIDQRKRNSIKGSIIIRSELSDKGISGEIIKELLDNENSEEELLKAKTILEKQLSRLKNKTDLRMLILEMRRYLFQRGFASGIINRAIDEFVKKR